MGSLDSVLTRKALGRGLIRQINNDAQIGIRVRYIGTGTVTSIEVVTGTDVELISSDGGTETFTFATYTTVGAVADVINASQYWEAKVIDALRSEGSNNWFLTVASITSGTDVNGVTVWDMVADTSGAATLAIALGPQSPDWDLPAGHRVSLLEFVYYADLTAAADSVQVWIRRKKGNTETQVYGLTSVDVTKTTESFASGRGFLTGGIDDEIIIQISGTVVNSTSNYIRAIGHYE